MRAAAIGFALGTWLLQRQPELPAAPALALLAVAAFGAVALAVRSPAPAGEAHSARRWRIRPFDAVRTALAFAGAAGLGFAWAGLCASARLADRLDPALEGEDVVLSGVIAALPQRIERGTRFDLDVAPAAPGVPRKIALAWYHDGAIQAPPVRAGERWQFTVRLRRPHGGANPHGFDYEAWLLERGIRATGYVRPAGENVRLEALAATPQAWLARLRERLREGIFRALPDAPYAGVLAALALGDQNAIPAEQWRLFAATGVSHLMSISGLHVTMISGLVAALVFGIWRRRERLALALPAHKAAAAAGFLAAFAYCLVSGFAVPAQRTLYMVGVVAAALASGRIASASQVLAWALFAVLALDPWAVLAPGFWLSFGAVALIFYVNAGRISRPHWLAQWARVQWAVTLGLAPLLLVLFQQVSLVSPLANAVAIPLVSFAITPLALVGAVLPGDGLLALAHRLLEAMMALLEALTQLPGALWQQHAPVAWSVPLAAVGVLLALAPRGLPGRFLGAPLAAPLFLATPSAPSAGELWLAVLDVGQGLAVLARTAGHALLYDAGPRYHDGADAGSRVVVPYLRGEGVAALDALVVSHDDEDHAGGAASVIGALPVGTLWSSLPQDHPLRDATRWRADCAAGRAWRWDGVTFEFLHPRAGAAPRRPNDASCVLRIEAGGRAVLITGDIERRAERELLARAPERLAADALLVPHHGSRSSSSPEFVGEVAPRYAVFAVGYRSRFGHPRKEIVERYRAVGAEPLRTDLQGAIELRMSVAGLQVLTRREIARRYWHGE